MLTTAFSSEWVLYCIAQLFPKNFYLYKKMAKSSQFFNSWLQNSESFLQRITFLTSI